MADLADALADYVAPRFILVELELEELKADEIKDLGKAAAEAAEDLLVDSAYVVYRRILDKDPFNPALHYDVGLLHETVGNNALALEAYQQAVSMDPQKKYQQAIDRVRRAQEFDEALSSVGVQVVMHAFPDPNAVPDHSADVYVIVRGKRSDRVPVYSARSAGQELAQVPGGIRFRVLDSDEGWFHVQLPDGRDGFIRSGDVQR